MTNNEKKIWMDGFLVDWNKAVIDTINANKVGEESYIRPIAYYGYGKMGVNPLPNKVSIAIAMWEWDEYLKKEKQHEEKGIRLMVSAWMRIDGRTMPFLAKATANYANSALARVEALKAGFDEAIMLNTNGKVVEASAENIFIVRDSLLITPPTSSGALNGITRDTVLAIAKENKIRYEIRDISRDELYISDEIFLTGTAAGINPVAEIDNRSIADGKEGWITRRLKERFELVVYDRDDELSKKWLTYVE